VRGSPLPWQRSQRMTGTIPARAGEPPRWSRATRSRRDHPRACGGAKPRRSGCAPSWVPARAGEPARGGRARRGIGDHPRACGGACSQRSRGPCAAGPSPRVRGSPPQSNCLGGSAGTIPARAGEPERRGASPHRQGDHPRACGGAQSVSSR